VSPLRPTRRFRGDDGAVLVEAALVLPIILFVMLGMVEYSVAELQANQASSAARDGARVGILDYKQADVPGSAANNAIVAAVNARLLGQRNVTVTVTCLKSDGTTVVCANAVAEQDRIQVVTSWPYQKITGILPVVPKTITSTSRMALVGQVLSMSTTTSTPSSTSSSTTSTSSTSTSSTSSTTTTTTGSCVISALIANNGTAGQMPSVNNAGKLSANLQVKFTGAGSTCGQFTVTVYPYGAGAPSGNPYDAPNGVSSSGSTYTAIFGKNDKNDPTWSSGPLYIEVTSSAGAVTGTTNIVVTLG
jgi:Flp pilus assembly protein TadG